MDRDFKRRVEPQQLGRVGQRSRLRISAAEPSLLRLRRRRMAVRGSAWVLAHSSSNCGAAGAGLLDGLPAPIQAACEARTLNALMACGNDGARSACAAGSWICSTRAADESTRDAVGAALSPMEGATLLKPVEPANYTDFYASIHHATRVGRLFRPEIRCFPTTNTCPSAITGGRRRLWSAERRCAGRVARPSRSTGGVPGIRADAVSRL